MLSLVLQPMSTALLVGGQEKVDYTSAFEAATCVVFLSVPGAKASRMAKSRLGGGGTDSIS